MAEEVLLITDLDHDNLAPGAVNQPVCASLTIQTSDQFATKNPQVGCSLLLLLDTSGSMDEPFSGAARRPTKREAINSAAKALLPHLLPEDRISLTFFDSNAYSVLSDVSGADHASIVRGLDRINEFSGSTNFEAAFANAHEWANRGSSASRKVLFLTDGRRTHGRIPEINRLNANLAQAGVTVDCLGVGTNFAFSDMQSLSAASGGLTFHLADPGESELRFREILQTAQRSLVHNTLLRLRVPAHVRDLELYQLSPEVRYFDSLREGALGGVDHAIQVGALNQNGCHSFVIAGRLDAPSERGPLEFCLCRLDYTIPQIGLANGHMEQRLWVNVGGNETWDSTVTAQYQEASLARLESDFRQCLDDWQAAARILEQMKGLADQLHLRDKAATYRRYQQRLLERHQLSLDDLNRLFAKTSRSTLAPGRRTNLANDASDLDF